jgi:hypothetical protein
MPTTTKLIAAVLFAVIGFFAAEAFKPVMPEGTQFGLFSPTTAFIGLLCGWMVMGKLAGKGYYPSFGTGIRTSVMLAIWTLLLFSIYLMVQNAFKMRYDTPMEALVGIFALMLEYGQKMLTVPVIVTLLVGGALAGLIAEWARKRWD